MHFPSKVETRADANFFSDANYLLLTRPHLKLEAFFFEACYNEIIVGQMILLITNMRYIKINKCTYIGDKVCCIVIQFICVY